MTHAPLLSSCHFILLVGCVVTCLRIILSALLWPPFSQVTYSLQKAVRVDDSLPLSEQHLASVLAGLSALLALLNHSSAILAIWATYSTFVSNTCCWSNPMTGLPVCPLSAQLLPRSIPLLLVPTQVTCFDLQIVCSTAMKTAHILHVQEMISLKTAMAVTLADG